MPAQAIYTKKEPEAKGSKAQKHPVCESMPYVFRMAFFVC
jgi:hypothetical protein